MIINLYTEINLGKLSEIVDFLMLERIFFLKVLDNKFIRVFLLVNFHFIGLYYQHSEFL